MPQTSRQSGVQGATGSAGSDASLGGSANQVALRIHLTYLLTMTFFDGTNLTAGGNVSVMELRLRGQPTLILLELVLQKRYYS